MIRKLLIAWIACLVSLSVSAQITPRMFQCDSRGQVSNIATPADRMLAFVADNTAKNKLEIYQYFSDSVSAVDNSAVLASSTGSGRWLRVSSTTASGGGGGSASSGTAIQKGDGAGAFVAAVAGTDYLAPVNPMNAITATGTNYTIDASLGVLFSVINPSGNFGLIITNGTTWKPITLGIRQDSTGVRYGMPLGTNWVFGSDITTNGTTGLSLTTNAGAWDWFRVMCVSNTYHVVGQTRGFLAP